MPDSKFADESEVKVAQLMTPEWANFYGYREERDRFLQQFATMDDAALDALIRGDKQEGQPPR